MGTSPKRPVAQSRRQPGARRPRPVRLRLEALEERLAPDAGGVTAEPNEFRKLMAFGNAVLSRDELLQLPEFYDPDLAAINAPVSGQRTAGRAALAAASSLAAPLVADPGAMGPLAITVQDYNFGNERFDPVSI